MRRRHLLALIGAVQSAVLVWLWWRFGDAVLTWFALQGQALWRWGIELYQSLAAWVQHFIHTLTLGKALVLVTIGVARRFLIEDLLMAPVMQYFWRPFRRDAMAWAWLLSRRLSSLWWILCAPLLALAAALQLMQLLAFAWTLLKSMVLNKLMSLIKLAMLHTLPWLFGVMVEFTHWLIYVFEYIILAQLGNLLRKLPWLGAALWQVFSWLQRLAVSLDAWIQGRLMRRPKLVCFYAGRRVQRFLQQRIEHQGYSGASEVLRYRRARSWRHKKRRLRRRQRRYVLALCRLEPRFWREAPAQRRTRLRREWRLRFKR